MRVLRWLCLVMMSCAGGAHAQVSPDAQAPVAQADEPAAPAPAEATPDAPALGEVPRPDKASGIAIPEDHSVRDGLLWIPRILLFVPRWVVEVAFIPLRALAWAFERFDYVITLFTDFFFTEDRRFGAFPTALFETGFGLNIGARVHINDLTGYDEKWRLRAGFGGRFRQLYQAQFRSGRLLGDHVGLEIRAQYNISPARPFYGIGNGDITELTEGGDLLDPYDGQAVATRYRENRFVWGGVATTQLGALFSLRLSHIWEIRTFAETPDDDGDTTRLTDVYDKERLVAYDEEIFNVYNELALTFSTTRSRYRWISKATPSTGWWATLFGGHVQGVSDDPSGFGRAGVDVIRYIDLALGDRVLMLRAFLDTTIGTREHIPFDSYPSLGGGRFLRGYPLDRFRDRVAGMGSAQYNYSLNQSLSAYMFTDIGRVWSEPDAIKLTDMRQTYGAGIELHSLEAFIFRVQAAVSQEGDFFFELSFNPTNSTRARF